MARRLRHGMWLPASWLSPSDSPAGLGTENIDATAALILNTGGGLLGVFETEENAWFLGFAPDNGRLFDPVRIRRTDLIPLAVGKDGTVYFGTSSAPTRPTSFPVTPTVRLTPSYTTCRRERPCALH